MSTKEDLSDQLNQLLGVNVEWSKMSRENLETLVKLFGDPMGIVQLGIRMMKEKTREDIMGRKLGDVLSSSTILNLRERSRGGPLGLGILPGLLGQTDKTSEKISKETEPLPKEETREETQTEKTSEPEPAAEKHKDEEKSEA